MEVSKELDLLDGWWTSQEVHTLERRAIFSTEWICVAHSSRFTKSGDYITFDLAGYPILVILGKDRIIRSFHNVCRHRAYTITKKSAGSSLVLGCRYHGWSYDTRGRLVKAPHFDGIEGFEKSQNGLFSIKTCVDRVGFIYITLYASELDNAPNCSGVLKFSENYSITAASKRVSGWDMEGNFNWKILVQLDVSAPNNRSLIEILITGLLSPQADANDAKMFHHHPLTTLIVFPNAQTWAMLTVLPISAIKCTVHCDLFMSVPQDPEPRKFENLKSYIDAHIHALEKIYEVIKKSRPPESFMTSDLKAHLRLEKLTGMEIYPAKTEDRGSESYCKAERGMCVPGDFSE
ncbi:Rieske [2Fe-2S] iron-sulfur domain-containing protein [Dendryphion nanum]|uniref:Rieske [2Fe-2S] iron-sulfur domain-containing protein n=1 Tax=Dendryphion nanum TaxID=256645 RepID=A0A9P9DVB7_9PLEO|nr:Rieske [2Fe-2S] iron-sulfur domain-containing protein [Dendryphion nanum]